MVKVIYQYFDSVANYQPLTRVDVSGIDVSHIDFSDPDDKYDNSNFKSDNCLVISMNDFEKYSIDLGNYEEIKINSKIDPDILSQNFYKSLIPFMIKQVNEQYVIRKNFKDIETSIKGSLNFFMGMVAAKAVADKGYGIKHLFHLTDKMSGVDVEPRPRNQDKHPDFVGISNSNNEAYVIEAKGQQKNKISADRITNAEDQLNAINKVVDRRDGLDKEYDEINKHIIASTYYHDGTVLHFHDIDPKEKGKITLVLDTNQLTINYYKKYMHLFLMYEDTINKLIKKYNSEQEIDEKNEMIIIDEKTIKINLNDMIIGIDKQLFNYLKKYRENFQSLEDIKIDEPLHKTVRQILSENNIHEKRPYYYSDGIYYKKNNLN